MAISAATVFEVRTAGSDSNGGGFVSGASGTDFSQQDSAQYTFANLAGSSANTASPTVTSTSHNFVAADVGNIMQITAGTNWTTGFYQIVSVAANAATLDKACASVASPTSGTFFVGGALLSPGKASSAMVAGNTMWIKSGSYSITSASTNVAAGCISMAGGTATLRTRMIGYTTSRGDGGRPTLTASGIATFTLISTGTGNYVEAVICDGASLTSSRAFNNNGATAYKCKGLNCTNSAFSTGPCVLCEATGCTTQPAFSTNTCQACASYSNTSVAGFSNCNASDCYSINNSGASGIGFLGGLSSTQSANCVAYGNGGSGFKTGTQTGTSTTWINCISTGNSGWGYESQSSYDSTLVLNCAAYNNTSGTNNMPNSSVAVIGFITLTGDPYNNAAGNDFSLNNTASAGASCRNAATPISFPGLSTNNYLDIGAADHQDPAGSAGMLYIPDMDGGLGG